MEQVDITNFDGVYVTPQKVIFNEKGEILHALKASDSSFSVFGEAYFSSVNQGETKGWKQHTKMTMNIVVPIGGIEFFLISYEESHFTTVKINRENYARITVEPGVWMAFKGLESYNLILNIASIEHDPQEAINKPLSNFNLVVMR